MFCLPCKIGKKNLLIALIDLGAFISIMFASLFYELKLLNLCSTGVVVQLADGSLTKSLGVLKDVFVNVDGLVFPLIFMSLILITILNPLGTLLYYGDLS